MLAQIIKPPQTMAQQAHWYHKLGFNVVPLLSPSKRTKAKATWVAWKNGPKNLQVEPQTTEDIEALAQSTNENFNFTWGMLGMSGVNALRCFDIDKAPTLEAVYAVLHALGFPRNYAWATLSGSGKGNHVWFYCNDTDEDLIRAGFPASDNGVTAKAKYDQHALNPDLFAHVELRWNKTLTVLPPSLHPSGGTYTFLHGMPTTGPSWATVNMIKTAWDTVAQPFPQKEHGYAVQEGAASYVSIQQETSYGKKVLETSIEKLRNLTLGDERYTAAYATAAYLFEWANGGQLNHEHVRSAVFAACVENGCVDKHGEKDILDTIEHAMQKTKDAQRTPPCTPMNRKGRVSLSRKTTQPTGTIKIGEVRYA